MASWLIAGLVGLAGAAFQYGWRRGYRSAVAPYAAFLRAVALTLVMALLLDAPVGVGRTPARWVALDVSASLARGRDTALWRAARDSARAVGADSIVLFGDSLRSASLPDVPSDQRSDVRPVVERAMASGRPVVVVTDGELTDAEALRQLPAGSRVVLVARAANHDVAAAALDMPRAVVGGDTAEARLTLASGPGGARAGTASLLLGDKIVATAQFDSLAPFSERDVTLRARIDVPEGPALLRAIVSSPGDAEPRNDTLGVGIDVSRQPGAVFVSTSPDYDARYALSVLRGALALPTRGFYRVSPGSWRVDGTFAPVTEAEVRAAFRDAPVAILHGDTSLFGPPRQATSAPLALMVPTEGDGSEWYAADAPASPLSVALAGLPWDSLPPIAVGGEQPGGVWHALEARRGREAIRRTIVAGTDEPRRVVTIGASGLWRWRFRGGAASDAYTALWGGIFDWLASERADRRAAVPDARVVRAGEPVRWRRGSAVGDSVVIAVLARRGTSRVDSVRLRFGGPSSVAESAPLPQGVYDVGVRGGRALLVVNASSEWVPRLPSAARGAVGGLAAREPLPRARDLGWVYALVVLLLCAEWLLRRRGGLR
jgi:hypothetical protein